MTDETSEPRTGFPSIEPEKLAELRLAMLKAESDAKSAAYAEDAARREFLNYARYGDLGLSQKAVNTTVEQAQAGFAYAALGGKRASDLMRY